MVSGPSSYQQYQSALHHHLPSLYQDYPSHGPDVGLAVQQGRGVPVEVSVVRPGLGGQAAGAHCGSPGLEVEPRHQRLHQQSSPLDFNFGTLHYINC